jgi:hypothetical protein
MTRRRFLEVTVGVLVLSAGLVIMADSAGAAPLNKSVTPTQDWDENLPPASRFTTIFTGAVRDNNTGLVWEQAPDATARTWADATGSCVNKTVGGTVGWRLPSVVELNSVRDPSLPAPFVPASAFTIGGTPGVQLYGYWSATTDAANPPFAWLVVFITGSVSANDKTVNLLAWCVRGGMNADSY